MINFQHINNVNFLIAFKGNATLNIGPNNQFKIEDSLKFIENNIIKAPDDIELKKSITTFKDTFIDIYELGINKTQNPLYHQYTVTDHMLKAIFEASKIAKNENETLIKLTNQHQRDEITSILNQKVGRYKKKDLFILAMAFHDLDKIFVENKLQIDYTLKPPKNLFHTAIEEFDKLAQKMKLNPTEANYVKKIINCHDYPLYFVSWPIENGEKNTTILFEELKIASPLPLKDLALVFLADQSAKGNDGWLEHLEKLSPWKGLFKSMIAERPLSDIGKSI